MVIKGQNPHRIPDGGAITFREVSGMTELNGKTVKVKGK